MSTGDELTSVYINIGSNLANKTIDVIAKLLQALIQNNREKKKIAQEIDAVKLKAEIESGGVSSRELAAIGGGEYPTNELVKTAKLTRQGIIPINDGLDNEQKKEIIAKAKQYRMPVSFEERNGLHYPIILSNDKGIFKTICTDMIRDSILKNQSDYSNIGLEKWQIPYMNDLLNKYGCPSQFGETANGKNFLMFKKENANIVEIARKEFCIMHDEVNAIEIDAESSKKHITLTDKNGHSISLDKKELPNFTELAETIQTKFNFDETKAKLLSARFGETLNSEPVYKPTKNERISSLPEDEITMSKRVWGKDWISVEMWGENSIDDVKRVTYYNDGKTWRGNLFGENGKPIGDFVAMEYDGIQKAFPNPKIIVAVNSEQELIKNNIDKRMIIEKSEKEKFFDNSIENQFSRIQTDCRLENESPLVLPYDCYRLNAKTDERPKIVFANDKGQFAVLEPERMSNRRMKSIIENTLFIKDEKTINALMRKARAVADFYNKEENKENKLFEHTPKDLKGTDKIIAINNSIQRNGKDSFTVKATFIDRDNNANSAESVTLSFSDKTAALESLKNVYTKQGISDYTAEEMARECYRKAKKQSAENVVVIESVRAERFYDSDIPIIESAEMDVEYNGQKKTISLADEESAKKQLMEMGIEDEQAIATVEGVRDKLSEKQRGILESYNFNPDELSYKDCSYIIGELKELKYPKGDDIPDRLLPQNYVPLAERTELPEIKLPNLNKNNIGGMTR